ncbi:Fanconi anemia group D2 protein [Populus alba x Populus x berolinensis]|nr:Fanconi anemia group D2 protein [Populus alba x Populus x berolinensis]
MVFLHQQNPSRKRPSSFIPPFPQPKIPKSSTTTTKTPPQSQNEAVEDNQVSSSSSSSSVDKLVSILADAGCTLINPSGPPCLPSDHHKFRNHLNRLFSSSDTAPALRSDFLSGFSSYINLQQNFRRVLAFSKRDGFGAKRSESLVRQLLLVPAIQLDLQIMLLEKLPEYFDTNSVDSKTTLSLEDDVARLIIDQFRWLDFVVDPNTFTDKLLQVVSICPLHLKKEIIGSLPEIIGDQSSNNAVVDSLDQMLQEDSEIIVPVLDAFSNLNLDEMMQEQVISTALSCIRTIDGEHIPNLLSFLLLSATPQNVRRIISQIRQQLKFVGMSNSSRSSQQRKLKGKSLVDNTEASILDALRSSLLFKNMLCQEVLKELSSVEKPQDHKVIDIWLLILIYMNGKSMQKSVEKILKKKIVESCIREDMIDQCICGNKELVQDYFPWFLSLSEHLLACKEQKARDFGIHIYICLFGEFGDAYFRQEVLGALVTHVGSGVSFEVNSSLNTMALLASKYPQELIPLSAHINGILDYLEGFCMEHLHKVYEVFSKLALAARSSKYCFGSSIADELLMIIRKQVSHPDMKYKKMGLIGTLKVVSCLGDINNATGASPSQKSNCEEALELLRTSLDSCKQLCLPLVLFYDELTTIMLHKKLQPEIVEWVGKHAGEFESKFLSDLQGGQLPGEDSYCGLEGELWMNLDGDISPICLSILSLSSSSLQSTSSLQVLPANFLLLSAVERLTNQGSLSGIDALLGCPLHLPSSKYFSEAGWQSLTAKQKQIVCLSLYYAANWIRELLNAFCTQVTGRFECTSQATKMDIIVKLLKRLRNLVFLENLLNNCIKCHPLSLPELHLQVDNSGTLLLNKANNRVHFEKNGEHKKTQDNKHKKTSKESSSDPNGKLRQPTILDVLRKTGAVTSQDVSNEESTSQSSKGQTFIPADQDSCNSTGLISLEVSAVAKALEAQRFKFRPLHVQCYSLLMFSNNQKSCCLDPAVELPLYLYLLRDLHNKLDYFMPPGKQFSATCLSAPAGFTRMTLQEFLSNIRPLFPNLRRHFDNAIFVLKEGDGTCEDHWNVHSASAGNPEVASIVFSKSVVSTLVFKEVLHSFSKMLNLIDIQMHKSVLSDLLEAFQPREVSENVFSGLQHSPSPGTIEYLYLGASSFIEDALDMACSFSFMLASESLLTLESVVTSVQTVLDKSETNGKGIHSPSIHRILPNLRSRLGTSAQKLLSHNWDSEHLENGWKNKGEIVQKILQIYLENSESKSDLLDKLACSILPAVSSSGTTVEDDHLGFPTLCNATFVVWCRVLHEGNIAILNKLVKEIALFMKPRAAVQIEAVEKHLIKIQKSVNVVVSLVNLCRTHDKVTVRAMSVKYGGKFVDSFLKVFDFLQAHFQTHNELIIQLVTELQKATRTIQTLCSEAKGSKQTAITSKIPATKRSMERFLFRVKALLHSTSSGCTFWMGNLKHKDLTGQVVSSQAYADDQNNNVDEDLAEAVEEDQPVSVASEDGETE